ncbi:MAG: S-adenosylmethionine:tRNA ribosyltransferase-isomerase [Candidatus Shikimatogenerans bostrichidophilus]|nr:MAG: S-adenosylmethionine:tRNA ribosyltransferase-isomerase [Candidatus Shikimatogenerans bostrichidophilus]
MKKNFYKLKIPKNNIYKFPNFNKKTKLMILNIKKKTIKHKYINYLYKKYFNKNDIIIRNNTKCYKSFIKGYKIYNYKKSIINILLLKNINKYNIWEILVKPARKIRIGNNIYFKYKYKNKNKILKSKIIDNTSSKGRIIEFLNVNKKKLNTIFNIISKFITPKYIDNNIINYNNSINYQNHYSKIIGSIIFPNSGISLTNSFFLNLKYKNVNILDITYHLGINQILNNTSNNNKKYNLYSNYLKIKKSHTKIINNTNNKKNKICCIGINTLNSIELINTYNNKIPPYNGYINKKTNKNFNFKIINNLITKFHFPNSYSFNNISYFCGNNLLNTAYINAIKNKYKLLSYGDLLLIKK